jgi:prepilin-type N-terminal cleavage/methylation domain-containing protein
VRSERGFSLIEVSIAVGVVALAALGALGATMASRAYAVSTAAARFDALLDAARTIAREMDTGATITFTPDIYGDGFIARLYRNRPAAGTPQTTTVPALEARVSLSETTLGTPPFALAIHSNGAIAGIVHYTLGSTTTSETPCPAAGAYQLTFSYAGSKANRTIQCAEAASTTGPVSYAPQAPATVAPSPTPFPCAGSCLPTAPASPNSNPTCPPHYVANGVSTCLAANLRVIPTSLVYTSPGVPSGQTIVVQETAYTGPFSLSDTCAGAISYVPNGPMPGPSATYTVAGLRPANCLLTATDVIGNAATVTIGIGSPRQPRFVCDPRNPARPYDTDLGPDPDGIHEDYSTGSSCATPSPAPTNPPSSPTIIDRSVATACTQIFEDDWECAWNDSATYSFVATPGSSAHISASVAAASSIAIATMSLTIAADPQTAAIPITGAWDAQTDTFSVDMDVKLPASGSAYVLTANVSCDDQGYAQPQGTGCTGGSDTYSFLVTTQ